MTRWPAIAHTEHHWDAADAFGGAMRIRGVRSGRYRAADPPRIAMLDASSLSPRTLALAEDALLHLSRFDARLEGEVAAFGPLLLRSEAAASSRIEQLTASARRILTAELPGAPGKRDNAHLIVANTRAMLAAIELADRLDVDSVLRMHSVLLADEPRHTPGEWRDAAVWIGSESTSPITADYVAPDHTAVPELMDDLMTFARRDDLPLMAQIALTHAQFETIHPFSDGNGRTGRALLQAMLRATHVTDTVTVPVSAGLLADVRAYHQALTDYRAGDADTIVRMTAAAALRAVATAQRLVDDIRAVRGSWTDRITARRDAAVWRLLDLAARQPVLNTEVVTAQLGVSLPAASAALHQLQAAGILIGKTEYRQGVIWRADEVLELLDDFAEQPGRRSAT